MPLAPNLSTRALVLVFPHSNYYTYLPTRRATSHTDEEGLLRITIHRVRDVALHPVLPYVANTLGRN